jgi:hypothetical protein
MTVITRAKELCSYIMTVTQKSPCAKETKEPHSFLRLTANGKQMPAVRPDVGLKALIFGTSEAAMRFGCAPPAPRLGVFTGWFAKWYPARMARGRK